MRSWVPVPPGSPFPLENLPYGIFRRSGEEPRVGVAIGDTILDLAAVQAAGLLPGLPAGLFAAPALNGLLALGRPAWTRLRGRLTELLGEESRELRNAPSLGGAALVTRREAELLLPVQVGDYVDFYSSLAHATNLGRILRPGTDPLPPAWRHLPIGYHGRAGTLMVDGTPVRRPLGQRAPARAGGPPVFGPSGMLDVEVELGFLCGPGPDQGQPVAVDAADALIFGFVLVNDWSARDLQRWEYQPLGPFLSKSFATTLSPWVVTSDALAPFRVAAPAQEPAVLPYLQPSAPWLLDVELELELAPEGEPPIRLARTNARHLYWTAAQQLAHATVNGASVRPGDLYASGTISGPERDAWGSLMELSWGGRRPIRLPGGATREFVEDGDTLIITGRCRRPGLELGFGSASGRVLPAA